MVYREDIQIEDIECGYCVEFWFQNSKASNGVGWNRRILHKTDNVGFSGCACCQSYSVLVTADQSTADYYIVATPKMSSATILSGFGGIGVLHYDNSTTPVNGPLPSGPDPFDREFSINQAKSIR